MGGTNLQHFDNKRLAIISHSDYQSFIGYFGFPAGFGALIGEIAHRSLGHPTAFALVPATFPGPPQPGFVRYARLIFRFVTVGCPRWLLFRLRLIVLPVGLVLRRLVLLLLVRLRLLLRLRLPDAGTHTFYVWLGERQDLGSVGWSPSVGLFDILVAGDTSLANTTSLTPTTFTNNVPGAGQ